MRRASRSLLSQFITPFHKTNPHRLPSHNFFTKISSPILNHENPNPYNRTNSHQIHRNINTLVEKTPNLTPRQQKSKEKSEIEEEFESAISTKDILESFKAMETMFDEDDPKLGLACLKVGLHLDQEGNEPEKTLEFGNRALKILYKTDSGSISVAMTLHLMGSACYSLNRFNDSLGYLNKASKILSKLEEDGVSVNDVSPVLCAVQQELANVKTAMGRREEALVNHRKCLQLKELMLEPDSKELGIAHRDLAEAYLAILNFKEALPYCLKALQIHKDGLGDNSVEVALDRRLLGIAYTGLEDHEKALQQNQLSQKILKKWGRNTDLLQAEIEAANMLISLGKFDTAINTLKRVVTLTDKESKLRAKVFIAMANALCSQEKFSESKQCLDFSCKILEKKESEIPIEVAEAYMEIAMLYETMNEFEIAITLYKRTLAILEKLPQEQHSEGGCAARLGWLLQLTGKVQECIPYLEKAVELLKESFGPKHFGVGYIHNNLGAAYLELDRPQSAAQMFAIAKDIMDVALGPHHIDSIEACQNLSKAYDAMGSYPTAIEFQQRAVDEWESHGPSAVDEFREATRVLEQLKKKALGSYKGNIPMKALPLPRSSNESAYNKKLETDVEVSKLMKAVRRN